ncbi:ImmA/IrrE family metallo-endopeptidase [Streptomyces sp. B15]|uniref:ImmA/IrrE family metallo-endopeptidase n=1 Tax=Streptomyces sp. B15 TaxID=1537797 RepID=UPI001B37E9CF|nr:ImmA/IrrE family metallo-endopeptidase [Streptomyces sp. B15]MBQ1122250.1 ImmA/IrrE family metallo-endopeptidase [Streptomyces sp. B15]
MSVRVRVEPEVLLWAVERAGWSEDVIARRAPRLEQWLAGGTRPTLKQLEKFAHATHTPVGLLFLSEPPTEEVPIPDMRTMGNHAVERPSADLLDTIYACQSRQEWYEEYAATNGLPEVDFAGTATTSSDPAGVASEIRRRLNFEVTDRAPFSSWEDTLRQLIDRIESIGVLVMVNGIVGSDTHRRLKPEEFRGFALADRTAPLIFVNGADTKAAQIFTMAHELAHIWLGESALSDAAMARVTGNEAELWCNRVAAEVLVPLGAIRSEYRGEASVAELERLARIYRISTLVVLKRLYDARYFNWDEFTQLYAVEHQRIAEILRSRRRAASGGNYYYTQPIRLSRKFARAVISDTFEGGTAFRDAYRLLGTKKHETFENLASEIGVA